MRLRRCFFLFNYRFGFDSHTAGAIFVMVLALFLGVRSSIFDPGIRHISGPENRSIADEVVGAARKISVSYRRIQRNLPVVSELPLCLENRQRQFVVTPTGTQMGSGTAVQYPGFEFVRYELHECVTQLHGNCSELTTLLLAVVSVAFSSRALS